MIAIPLSILALAAGIYLLIYVKQSGLGPLYRYLSWLVVLLSLFFIVCCVVRGVRHERDMRECHTSGRCGMGHHGEGACPYMKGGPGCCVQGGSGTIRGAEAGCNMGSASCCAKPGEGGKSCCNKEGEAGMASSCSKSSYGAKAACCAKADADSTAKK